MHTRVNKRSWLWLIVLAFLTLTIAGCEDGPAEKAGETIDDAVDKAEESVEEAAEKAGDAVKEAGDAVEKATDN